MAMYSQRFWDLLMTLDMRLVAALRLQQEAVGRLLVCRTLIVGSALDEFRLEVQQCSADAAATAAELQQFCAGRSASQLSAKPAFDGRHPAETFAY